MHFLCTSYQENDNFYILVAWYFDMDSIDVIDFFLFTLFLIVHFPT